MVSPQRISMLAIPHRILSSIFPSRAQPSRHCCFRSSRPWHVKGTLVVVPRAASRSSFVPKIPPVIAVFVAVARGTSKIPPVIAVFVRPWHVKGTLVVVPRAASRSSFVPEIPPVIAVFVAHRFALPFVLPSPVRHAVRQFISGHSDIDDRAVDSHVDDANDRMDQDQDQDDAEAQIRNPYIDDSAVEAHEDDADDEMDDDEDDAEAQIRAADARDFPLRSTPDMPPPATPPAASAALSMLASSAPSNLDLLASASALRERTPLFLPDPESREPTPFDSRYSSPFNVTSMARLPSPTTFEEAHADVSAPSTHSRPSSPDVERPAKRIRLHSQPLQLRRVRKFFDVHASDSEDGDNDDEEGSMHDSDIEWIDDQVVDTDAPPLPGPPEDPNEADDLRALASHYERSAQGYQDPNDESEGDEGGGDDDGPGKDSEPGVHDSQLLFAVRATTTLVMPRPDAAALPIGTWFYDHSGPRNKALALVVSPTEFVRRNDKSPTDYPRREEYDACVLEVARTPLLKRNYQSVKPPPEELVPFWQTQLPHVHGLVPLPLPSGNWIRLRSRKRSHPLALVISATQCIVPRLPDSIGPDVCEIVTKTNPPFFRQNYMTVQPTPDDMIPFQASRLSAIRSIQCRTRSTALVPGDRVLIQDGPEPEGEGLDAGDSGWIIELRDFDLTNSIGTVFGQIPKAKVTALDYLPNEKITEAAPGRWLKLSKLRRHALAFSPPLRLLDRISCRRSIGVIQDIDESGFVVTMTLNDADSTTMECALEDVRREFQHGDAVIVDAGQHKGRQGFVVAVQRGGALQIFDSAEPQPGEDIPQYQNFHVHSAHVNFLNERSPLGGQFSPTSGVIQRAAETTASLNTVGRPFEGMFVRVVGNVLKNKAGMVVGDFDSPRRANRLDAARRANPAVAHNFRLSDFRGIMVTVREDKKNTTFTVNIKLLVKADGVALLRYDIQLSPD
ncbi:hypothetical protein B0H15DRAFT_956981 [Mycena belliarum]|uniref:Uncharacterized protein n=1 Tax=Mycena belliarum TaxID=1033014 RepID=A0AAD6TRR7_9AGAR|nr:hypothetical protein B0H15DRAFT_956981 [Mycena belliae]